METESLAFLRRLLEAPGPSGYEQRPSRVWRSEAESFADELRVDVLGNSYARLAREGAPVVAIEGHIDEIGLMVTHIDEQGYLWFDAIGGWDTGILTGQRVTILGSSGEDVAGVIGRKAAHLLSQEDRRKAPDIFDLWIDIGASTHDEAASRVSVGDAAVIAAPFVQLTDDRVVSRSLDNRVGAFVALEALRRLHGARPAVDAFALAATQEEVSFAGAYTSAFQLAPLVSVVIDVTHATDYPAADKKRDGDIKIGGGPVLSRGASLNPVAFDRIRDVAQEQGIAIQVQGAPRSSGTDADAMIRTGAGTATVLVSIPNRYMHSPNELVSLTDLERAAELIAAFVQTIAADPDFRP